MARRYANTVGVTSERKRMGLMEAEIVTLKFRSHSGAEVSEISIAKNTAAVLRADLRLAIMALEEK